MTVTLPCKRNGLGKLENIFKLAAARRAAAISSWCQFLMTYFVLYFVLVGKIRGDPSGTKYTKPLTTFPSLRCNSDIRWVTVLRLFVLFFDLAPRSPPGKRRATVHSISSNVATVAACTIPYVQPTHGTCDRCGCHARGESAQVEVKVVRLPQNHSY